MVPKCETNSLALPPLSSPSPRCPIQRTTTPSQPLRCRATPRPQGIFTRANSFCICETCRRSLPHQPHDVSLSQPQTTASRWCAERIQYRPRQGTQEAGAGQECKKKAFRPMANSVFCEKKRSLQKENHRRTTKLSSCSAGYTYQRESAVRGALHLLLFFGWASLGNVLTQSTGSGILVVTTPRCRKVGANNHKPCAPP